MRRNLVHGIISLALVLVALTLSSAPQRVQSAQRDSDTSTDAPYYTDAFTLSNGNLILTAFVDDPSGRYAVQYLYNGQTGELIAQLTDSPLNGTDYTIIVLPNGNFLISYPYYDADPEGAPDVGAVYLFNATTGERISALTGAYMGDKIGVFCHEVYPYGKSCDGSVKVLPSENFLVVSSDWSNGLGAVTWCSGTQGCAGEVTSNNSLTGGATTVVLPSGNYVVSNSGWNNAAGAVAWCSGTSGCTGPISSVNSLIGDSESPNVQLETVLANGNYLVVSSIGVTWCAGTSGCHGSVRDATTLLTIDPVYATYQKMVAALPNGNYVVSSPSWNNYAGAATWCDGRHGCVGSISSANSLVGSSADNDVNSTTVLSNGNYLVFSENGGKGAVTLCNGTGGCTGTFALANSLAGTTIGDFEYTLVSQLRNGSFVLFLPEWDNGPAENVGAATWCNGTSGCKGIISEANSLIGTATYRVGDSFTELTNGNYVVSNLMFGIVTWCSGSRGCIGKISADNSLVELGFTGFDPKVTPLSNGNYVVHDMRWTNHWATEAGFAKWCDGMRGCTGTVSAANSLVGSIPTDWVGYGIAATPSGDYFVLSPYWNNQTTPDAGAVTWCDGTRGCTGVISEANSLVGTTNGDRVGYRGVTYLANGNYVIRSPHWGNGSPNGAGAVTWCHTIADCTGPVSTTNSLVGSSISDHVGTWEPLSGVIGLPNGNYIVESPEWNSHTGLLPVGATTWCNGLVGCQGVVSSTNSLIGISASVWDYGIKRSAVVESTDSNYIVSGTLNTEAVTNTRAATFGDGWFGTSGLVTPANSVIGDFAYDRVHNQFAIGQAGDSAVTLLRPNFRPLKTYLPLAYK